ncbi:MAG TPA: NAD(P)/FAD-dependent oxidoreductase [Gemmatimonadales bacterium]|nr:NAD(P)/FAD-dependent oxidoreductase [Gemmatimonadales bacterium]
MSGELERDERVWDCVVVGAGPAGLSAALLLGRCRRRVLVCDTGRPRNSWSAAVHGFFTRDATPPRELLRLGRTDFLPYDTVVFRDVEVTAAARAAPGAAYAFEVATADGRRERCRKLLLATGVLDVIPAIPGIEPLLGTSVHHCPYCDGWEHREQRIAAYGPGDQALGLALGLTVWAAEVVLLSDGRCPIDDAERARLDALGIVVREEKVVRLEGSGGCLERVVFDAGPPEECQAFFFDTSQRQHSPLAAALGCRFNAKGTVETGDCEATNVPGLFVAGDASKETQLVSVAVAEGTQAAFAINRDLLKEDLAARERLGAARPSPA